VGQHRPGRPHAAEQVHEIPQFLGESGILAVYLPHGSVHVVALAGQLFGGSKPEAGAGTGNQQLLSVQLKLHHYPRLLFTQPLAFTIFRDQVRCSIALSFRVTTLTIGTYSASLH
jgi:hypothetical protein